MNVYFDCFIIQFKNEKNLCIVQILNFRILDFCSSKDHNQFINSEKQKNGAKSLCLWFCCAFPYLFFFKSRPKKYNLLIV